MKAMIFAAGLGSRLKPLTDTMPKALVPVAGRPMLEHVILKLKASGFTELTINIHHLGEQIIEFLKANGNFGLTIHLSDERDALLDTGGGIRKAAAWLTADDRPFLVHNADILSTVDLRELYKHHVRSGSEATLLVSPRDTARRLWFDGDNRLRGWTNNDTGAAKPVGFVPDAQRFRSCAFSGIHVVSPSLLRHMDGADEWQGSFSIMDFYLHVCEKSSVTAYVAENLKLIDIGKPETLALAETFVRTNL